VKLLGHGIDLISLSSFRNLMATSEAAFLSRTFQKSEVKEFPDGPKRMESIAGRFAAKEAVLKALGTGYGNGIAFTDVRVFREPGKAPSVVLSGDAKKVASTLGITGWQLSISHSEEVALASAIAVSEK